MSWRIIWITKFIPDGVDAPLIDDTPSFAFSLLKEYRNYGIGTELMKRMISELKKKGYKQASLSVQKINYAFRMYSKLGFVIIDENDEEYIMLCKL